MNAVSLVSADACYPARLRNRLGNAAPARLTALGNLELLALPKTGLFCSARCPGKVIIAVYDQAARWRESGCCIISGFHSPVEQECLRILLRGSPSIILCPARNLPTRIPTPLKTPLAQGRLLMLSGFGATDKRVTADLAYRRNFLVAALADDAYFGHITPGGQSERISNSLRSWRVPFFVGHNVENPD